MKTIKDDNDVEHNIDEDNFLVDGVLIKLDLVDVIRLDLEGFLDQISEDAGFPTLMAQEYVVEGHEGDTLLIRVRGDVSMHLEQQTEESEADPDDS